MALPTVQSSSLLPKLDMRHPHCQVCVSAKCIENRAITAGCPVEFCPNGCNFSMHACKLDEHAKHTCPEAVVPCPNAAYGCNESMKRKRVGSHIQHCPASIVMCKFSHQRVEHAPPLGLIDGVQASASAFDEVLVDQAFLDGDLDVWKTDRLELSTFDGKEKLSVLISDVKSTLDETPFLSHDTQIGLMTKQYWAAKKRYTHEAASLSRRACIDCDVSRDTGHEQYLTRSKKQKVLNHRACTFACNEIVRRDEFSEHWKSLHLDIQLGTLVRRCPMRLYGCQFGVPHMSPQPEGSQLEYDKKSDCFLYKMPSFVLQSSQEVNSGSYFADIEKKRELALYGYYDDEAEESFDVLGQLPAEVLLVIFGFLDSQSLWALSQVNYNLRKMSLNLVRASGIVYWNWKRDSSGSWKPGSKIWAYSKVFRGLSSWRYTEAPSIADHMMSCDYIKANVKPYTPDMVLQMLPKNRPV